MSYFKDLTVFEEIYNNYFVYLSLSSFQYTKDMEASKDIVQEYFIKLWDTENKIIFDKGFKSYSYKAIKNLSLKHLEKTKRNTEPLTPEFTTPLASESYDSYNDLKASKVFQLLEQVPESRKNIFLAHIINGMSYSEIAENQNISINTVKTQMKRVYAFIRGELSNNTAVIILYTLIETLPKLLP